MIKEAIKDGKKGFAIVDNDSNKVMSFTSDKKMAENLDRDWHKAPKEMRKNIKEHQCKVDFINK